MNSRERQFRKLAPLNDRLQLRSRLANIWGRSPRPSRDEAMAEIEQYAREKYEIPEEHEAMTEDRLESIEIPENGSVQGILTALIVFSTLLAIARNLLDIWEHFEASPSAKPSERVWFDE